MQVADETIDVLENGSARVLFTSNDMSKGKFSLDSLFLRNPIATFLMRYSGADLPSEHILAGDVLLIDRSLPFVKGALVVCSVDSDFLIGKVGSVGASFNIFISAHKSVKDIAEENIFGVIKCVIREVAVG